MKQKMKKCLCLMLSFMFVLSNCTQLFAQDLSGDVPKVLTSREAKVLSPHDIELMEKYGVARVVDVEVNLPTHKGIVTNMNEELKQLRHDFDAIKHYVDRVFGDAKHAEPRQFVIEGYSKFLEKFEQPYINFINEVNAYDAYVINETKKMPMERLAYKYTRRDPGVEHYAAGYALEEGSVFTKMKNRVKYVVDMGPQGVNNRTTGLVTEIPGIEQVQDQVNAALSHVEERLNLAEAQINRITTNNEAIRAKLTKYLAETGTTADDVVEYALKTIPEHDLKFLSLVKATEKSKISKFRMAVGWKKYLKAIGSRHHAKSSVFKLMKTVSAQSLHSTAYTKGYENLLTDFPVMPKKGYNRVARLGRKALNVTPLAIIGAFLTAAIIMETKSDNSFFANTIGPRAMKTIGDKINNNEASIGELYAYYNSPWTDSKWDDENIDKNVKHFINVINLAIAAGNTEENFDAIDNMFVEEEKSLALAEEDVNKKVQSQLDEQLANISEKVSKDIGMI